MKPVYMHIFVQNNTKLDMMFMIHYAPNPLLVKQGSYVFNAPNLQRAIT